MAGTSIPARLLPEPHRKPLDTGIHAPPQPCAPIQGPQTAYPGPKRPPAPGPGLSPLVHPAILSLSRLCLQGGRRLVTLQRCSLVLVPQKGRCWGSAVHPKKRPQHSLARWVQPGRSELSRRAGGDLGGARRRLGGSRGRSEKGDWGVQGAGGGLGGLKQEPHDPPILRSKPGEGPSWCGRRLLGDDRGAWTSPDACTPRPARRLATLL